VGDNEWERLDDLAYVRSFVPELSPEWLDLVAAVNGVDSPRARTGFRWCELGCGLGLTSVVCAALHPASLFTAVDSRADHTAAAEGLRRAARADNLTFHTRRFEDTDDLVIPPQNYIVVHGVYSWIDDASREALRAFIDRHLAPGGLVYLSYNALPGWAADATFQHLLRALAEDAHGDTLERFARSADTVQGLVGAGGGGALSRTVAGQHWSSYISRHDPAYLPHEYLVPGWRAFYVDEVRHAMGQLGLTPAGTATLEENFNAILLTPEQREALGAIARPDRRELARDFLIDQRFRRDVYARAPRPLTRDEQRHVLLDRPFVLLRPGVQAHLSISTPRGQVSCDTPTTRRLVKTLASGPKRLGDCVESGADPDALIAGMLMLCCAGVVWPAVDAPTDVSALNAALESVSGPDDLVYRVAPQATAVTSRRPSPLNDAATEPEL
jgi:SAM-dependent methyltransferase